MSPIVQWEVLVLAIGIVGWFALTMIAQRRLSFSIDLKAQAALSETQAAALIMGALALIVGVAVYAIFFTSAVKGCLANIRSIQTAAEAYRTGTNGSMPATTTAITIGTSGTFANPNDTKVDYLGQLPQDPANPTGSYAWSYTAATATAAELYVITCPGIHTKGDLNGISGASTETAGKIQWSSSGANAGFKAI